MTLDIPNENNTPRGHKRQQASLGLGIVTHLTKSDFNQQEAPVITSPPQQQQKQPRRESRNNAFFDTSSIQIKPPPSLIRTLSVKDYSGRKSAAAAAALTRKKTSHQPQTTTVQNLQQQQQAERRESSPSFADRIRGIVLASRKSTAAETPLSASIKRSGSKNSTSNMSICSTESSSSGVSSNSIQTFPEEKIIPLPSPAQYNTNNTASPAFSKELNITPLLLPPAAHDLFAANNRNISMMMMDQQQQQQDLLPPTSAIPLISLSPNFSPNKTNIIPSLIDVPMLGDEDEDETMTREYSFSSPRSATVQEDNMIGKHIWKFRMMQLLGVGAFSKVYLADNIEEKNGEKFACKMINKDRLREDSRVRSSIEREVGVLKYLNHDHIVQLEATMETEQHICIVLEYVQGEELFDFVQRMHTDIHKEESNLSVDENLVKCLGLELIQVTSWLHDHNIVHRDLKLENILVYFDSQGELHLKITDFGLARVVDPNEPTLTTRCGSEEYAAPEIVQSLGYDGRLTDTWSIGIILYAMLVGYLPFTYNPNKGEKISHLFHRIVTAQVKWPINDNISAKAKQVVESILVRQPAKRIRLNEIEKLPWFC